MNDDTQPVSGSRWETPDEQIPEQTTEQTTGVPAAPVPGGPPPPAYLQAAEGAPVARRRPRVVLAGAAAGIALVAGTGGFALGHATADGGEDRGQIGTTGFTGTDGTNGTDGTAPGTGTDGRGPDGLPGQGDGFLPEGGPGGVPPQLGGRDDDGTTPGGGTDDPAGTEGSHT